MQLSCTLKAQCVCVCMNGFDTTKVNLFRGLEPLGRSYKPEACLHSQIETNCEFK